MKNRKLESFGWILLLTAVIGDFTTPYLLALFYQGYSHSSMVMSSLGNPKSPVRIYYNLWLFLLGILLILSAFIVYKKYQHVSKKLSIGIAFLLFIFAIGAGTLASIFSVNESKSITTAASQIHGAGSAIGFMALLFVPYLIGKLLLKVQDKLGSILSFLSFLLSLLFFVLFVMSDKPEFANSWVAFVGTWQRLTLLFSYIPLGYIAVKNLFKIKGK
ncbi:MAG TPA: DUF998 domain-containing protein [Lachnospiraceae bacterium]|nr:DUF998 domain-containing protein [Lachnospiraceae bacterium]